MFRITELKVKFGGLQGQIRINKNILFLIVVFVLSTGNGLMKTITRESSECINIYIHIYIQ